MYMFGALHNTIILALEFLFGLERAFCYLSVLLQRDTVWCCNTYVQGSAGGSRDIWTGL